MNREYRVYDTEQKRYVTDERMWFISPDGTLYYLKTDNAGFVKAHNCVVEWAVGLPDQKGNKIFEGDIIRHEDFMGTVVYSGTGFCIKDIPQWVGKSSWYIINHCEVIGNKWENPELLKAK